MSRQNLVIVAALCVAGYVAYTALKPGAASAGTSSDLKAMATAAATKYGIPAGLFRALVYWESRWKPNARSPAGAMGLTQLMPATAAALGVTNAYDPAQSLEGGARYLAQMYNQFHTWPLALAAYNAGPGNVSKYGGIPPFPETVAYVAGILGLASLS